VRVVGGAVDRIEHPARAARCRRVAAELLRQHLVIGEPLGHHSTKHLLDGDVHVRDEIDGAFLVDAHRAAEAIDLNRAGAHDGLDGGGEEKGIARQFRRRNR